MAKTTRPSKQLELPIMVDLMLPGERRTTDHKQLTQSSGARQGHGSPHMHVSEATQADLSVYDAIMENYVRAAK